MLVRDISEDWVKELQRRAAAHGVSTEDEVRQILREALEEKAAPASNKKYTLFDHIMKLGDIAPDIDFDYPRARSKPRAIEF